MDQKIQETLKTLPQDPGVYQYYDKDGRLLYVGKAKNLKKRVSSYFNKEHLSAKTNLLVRKVYSIKTIVTSSEYDALLLENNLIKSHQPRYNVMLRDDKTYPWICIKKEAFPRVFYTRKIVKDGSEYFGPYASLSVMKNLLDLIREMYPIRTCTLNLSKEKIERSNYKVCLEYHIGKCLGPCEKKQTEEEYDQNITEIKQLIKGNLSWLKRELKEKMKHASAELNFEKAQHLKDRIENLENYQSRSTVVSSSIGNVDVLSIVGDNQSFYVNYMKVMDGSLIQSHTIEVKKVLDEQEEDVLEMLIPEMREKFSSESKEVIVPFKYSLEGIEITVPQRGEKKHLLELSQKNAKFFMLDKHKQEHIKNPEKNTERILETMKKDLRLSELPTHIECFDNSNLQGTNPVSACVVFKNAKPSKKDYRHFNVKTVEGPNDFATMEEVIYRRYKRLIDEGQGLPQLIIIDGGKGQLGSALNSLEKLGLRGKIAIIGIAKRLEEIYYPGDSLPLYIDKRSETLKIIQHLRNEAHRFGITHHRKRRSKASISSELDTIPGIGEKTSTDLVRRFGSVKRIKNLSYEELKQAIGDSKAKIIIEHFSKKDNEQLP